MNDRKETTQDRVGTIIQLGKTGGESSHDTALKVLQLVSNELAGAGIDLPDPESYDIGAL